MSKSRKFFAFITILALAFSCNDSGNRFRYDGGQLNLPLLSLPITWIPCETVDQNTQIVLSQIYETLVEIDQKSLQIKPLIAKSFTSSSDFTQFTFEIRDNIYFHSKIPGKRGKKLVASDVIKTFEYDCLQRNSAAYHNVLSQIKGAKEFREGKSKNISGIDIQEHQISIELIAQDPLFLNKLAFTSCAIIPANWIKDPKGNPPGTGPFYLKHKRENKIEISKNLYYGLRSKEGYSLPYLNQVNFHLYSSTKQATRDFLSQKIDVINHLDLENLGYIFNQRKEDFNASPPSIIYKNRPTLSSSLLVFNLNSPFFSSPLHRRIFNYAVNRNAFNRFILKNHSLHNPNIYGIIPPEIDALKNYDLKKLEPYSLDYHPAFLKNMNNNIGQFSKDTITLAVTNSRERIQLAREIAFQLTQNLKVNIQLKILSFPDFIHCINEGEADLYLMKLVADFPNPLSLMSHFYSGGSPDSIVSKKSDFSRYHNWYFDHFFEQASMQSKTNEQINSILLAEKELLKNPPFIVLYYHTNNFVRYSYVCNYWENLLSNINLRECYLKKH